MTRKEWSRMTLDAQRIRFAELRGWDLDPVEARALGSLRGVYVLPPADYAYSYRLAKLGRVRHGDLLMFREVPDCLSDLNVVREAVIRLEGDYCAEAYTIGTEACRYVNWLRLICESHSPVMATAAECTEAYVLAVMGVKVSDEEDEV